jgi:hypothetical protein
MCLVLFSLRFVYCLYLLVFGCYRLCAAGKLYNKEIKLNYYSKKSASLFQLI